MSEFSFNISKIGNTQGNKAGISEIRDRESFSSKEQSELTRGLTGNVDSNYPMSDAGYNRPDEVSLLDKYLLNGGEYNKDFFAKLSLGMDSEVIGQYDNEELMKVYAKYEGKKITPDTLNNLIGDVLNIKDNNYADILNKQIFQLQEYLTPETLDKFLNSMTFIRTEASRIGDEPVNLFDAEKFYKRLDANQRELYYEKLLCKKSAVAEFPDYDYVTGDFANFIFEKPLSDKTFGLLKNLIGDIKNFKYAEISNRFAVSLLENNKQITKTQMQELLNILEE